VWCLSAFGCRNLTVEHEARGVSIENLRFNGRPITNADDTHLRFGKFVQDVRFAESEGK